MQYILIKHKFNIISSWFYIIIITNIPSAPIGETYNTLPCILRNLFLDKTFIKSIFFSLIQIIPSSKIDIMSSYFRNHTSSHKTKSSICFIRYIFNNSKIFYFKISSLFQYLDLITKLKPILLIEYFLQSITILLNNLE